MGSVRHQSTSPATQKVTMTESKEGEAKPHTSPFCSLQRNSGEKLTPSIFLVSTRCRRRQRLTPSQHPAFWSCQGQVLHGIVKPTAPQHFSADSSKCLRRGISFFAKEKSQLHQRHLNISIYLFQNKSIAVISFQHTGEYRQKGQQKFIKASTEISQNVCLVPIKRRMELILLPDGQKQAI